MIAWHFYRNHSHILWVPLWENGMKPLYRWFEVQFFRWLHFVLFAFNSEIRLNWSHFWMQSRLFEWKVRLPIFIHIFGQNKFHPSLNCETTEPRRGTGKLFQFFFFIFSFTFFFLSNFVLITNCMNCLLSICAGGYKMLYATLYRYLTMQNSLSIVIGPISRYRNDFCVIVSIESRQLATVYIVHGRQSQTGKTWNMAKIVKQNQKKKKNTREYNL